MKDIKDRVANTIRSIRAMRQESLQTFVQALNNAPGGYAITLSTLSKYEHGVINPPAWMYIKILGMKPHRSKLKKEV